MADKRISELTSATSLGDADVFPIVQSGETKKLTGSAVKSYAQSGVVLASEKGANSGVATLGSDGKLTASQLPDLAVSDYLGSVATQSAMLALTGQKGDWCTRSDLGTTWVISGVNPASISSWTELNYPTAPVTSVAGKTGAVSLVKGDVGLGNVDNTSDANKPISSATQTALDGKANNATTLSGYGITDAQSKISTVGILKGGGSGSISAATAGTDYVAPSVLGANNGVATLDSGGKLTSTQIPDLAISDYLGSVASQTAMLALTGQKGDWCNRSDTGTVFVISGSDPTLIGSWTQLNYPTAPVTSVAGKTGAVTLAKTDVGLGNVDNTSDANKPISSATQTALDGKQTKITASGIVKGDGNGGITAAAAGTDFVAPGGSLGTPSSGTLSNCTVDGTNSIGFLTIPQNAQTGSYTLVAADSGKHIYHAAGAAAATYTIPANGSVAYPVGTAITFINLSTNAVTIAITTDTLYLAGTGVTGSRTLAQYGEATALKVTSTAWVISGMGLT